MTARRKSSNYQASMPFAREPFKTIYVVQRLVTTILMVPIWALYYSVMPRRFRPRPSWSLKQIIAVNFMRRIYKVAELAGVTWSTRDPEASCDNKTLKETRFEWVDPLPEDLRTGIVVDSQVPFKRVGTFVWPKQKPPEIPDTAPSGDPDASDVVLVDQADIEANASREPIIGIFLHGGGYCHMSAHEQCGPSRIPRRLMQHKAFTEIHAVEYRLLQHAPFPAAVQDAAAVYAHIVRRHQRKPPASTKSPKSASSQTSDDTDNTKEIDDNQHFLSIDYDASATKNRKEVNEIRVRVNHAARFKGCKIFLIGDSAGGNLVLALSRWIRDEGILPPPDGLLLLSPSCDPAHAFPESPSSYVPRPHASTDYLVDTPEPRALLQRTFLGHNPLETMHSPYVSPASMRVLRAFYGDAFAASVEDLTIERLDTAEIERLRTMASAPATPVAEHPPELGAPLERSPTSLARPIIASPRGMSLFTDFPRTCIVLGDAERLEREVMKLVGAMERDGVEVRTVWVEDGVHDVLQMAWWDERVRDRVCASIEEWLRDVCES
ncbi:alpha/beta-hydrolase [Obba rivulosa]|uniref:Alpha/beta-hydrolase n=1 Tax=Obba rivulosa TaxID=1052685 RepID=A0A8E2DII1_9APHY|nr:alpha/beta-hydrolase [Obba rivulosa]